TTQGSASATAPNAPPTVAGATLGPAVIREATTATCTAGAASDSDGDTVTVTLTWFVNGTSAGTGPTLTGAAFDKGDTIQCRATPSDGIESGPTVSSATQTVQNTPPTAPVVRVTPEVADSQDQIGCEIVTPGTDVDPADDTLDYVFAWDLDGTDWTSEATDVTYTDDAIPPANVLAGTYTCEAAAYDGEDVGDVGSDVHDVFEYYDRQKIRSGLQSSHVCALLDNGTVKCWGLNAVGQLGQGNVANLGDGAGEMGDALPAVDLPGTLAVEMIAVGASHVCALMEDNSMYCWGQNANGELGRSGGGQIGDGAGEMGDNLVAVPPHGQVAQLEAGDQFNCIRNTDGEVWCWGLNTSGQLGTGNTTSSSTPVQISLGTGRTATWIGLGSSHACAILDNDTVKCWGANASGQLGIDSATARGDGPGEMGDSLPAAILGAGTPVFVDGGAAHSCVRFSNNTIKCWGANGVGQLGRGNTTVLGDAAGEMATIGAISVSTTKTIQRLYVGYSHNCVVFTDGSMKCWGNGANYRLGYGDTTVRGDGAGEMGDSLPFVSLSGAPKAWNMELSNGFTCIATECGSVQCWGFNASGQLGLGSTTTQTLPSANLSLGTGRYVDVESGAGCLNPWSHTITIDGDPSDWLPSEQFATSQGGGTWMGVTWDSTYIYIATKHPDVAAGGSLHWFVTYFGNGSSTGSYTVRDGITHNTQEPHLAAPSQTAARWKADNSFDSALNGDAGLNAWFGTSWYFRDHIASSLLAESNVNQFMEYRIRRDELFLNFSVLVVDAHWVYEGSGFESSYAATPSNAHAQGVYDPDFAKYLRFQLNSSAGPAGAEIRDALP
ncbi:MAG TPA: hypothetical protein PKA64_15495, partial [Myxococcota bacterium]|nr:hypothetical protein [Myxococcota bacterium]